MDWEVGCPYGALALFSFGSAMSCFVKHCKVFGTLDFWILLCAWPFGEWMVHWTKSMRCACVGDLNKLCGCLSSLLVGPGSFYGGCHWLCCVPSLQWWDSILLSWIEIFGSRFSLDFAGLADGTCLTGMMNHMAEEMNVINSSQRVGSALSFFSMRCLSFCSVSLLFHSWKSSSHACVVTLDLCRHISMAVSVDGLGLMPPRGGRLGVACRSKCVQVSKGGNFVFSCCGLLVLGKPLIRALPLLAMLGPWELRTPLALMENLTRWTTCQGMLGFWRKPSCLKGVSPCLPRVWRCSRVHGDTQLLGHHARPEVEQTRAITLVSCLFPSSRRGPCLTVLVTRCTPPLGFRSLGWL